jgi:hypothetical protein
MTRRRSPLGFRTADERFIAAAEIGEVFRDGDSVRVDLRGNARTGGFFQFWTGNPAIAGTIVRLLPTTRTIEYEGATNGQTPAPRPPLSLHRRRRARRRFVTTALIVGLAGIGALLITDIAIRQAGPSVPMTARIPMPETRMQSVEPIAVPTATRVEVDAALADIRRFDDRMDGLRAQYRTASEALQSGQLSRDEFIDGIHKWLLPQWHALSGELASSQPASRSLTSLVHARLVTAALAWDRGLEEYAEGLRTNSYGAVMAAFDRMSNGNESRRDAWRMLEHAERALATPPPGISSSTPHTP